MSDLFAMLGRAARALDAQRYGMDVAGQNISNVNTPGYVRRSALLAEQPPSDPRSPGGGVDVAALLSSRAPLIESRLRYEQPLATRNAAIADQLRVLEASLGEPGASLDAQLAAFYNTYAALAQSPTSATARQQVLVEAQTLARGFNDMATRLETQRRSADAAIRADVGQLNALSAELADLNRQIGQTDPSEAQGLFDQQSSVIKAMSAFADIHVIDHENGVADVVVGNGRALVIGSDAFDLTISSSGAGYAMLFATGSAVPVDITTEIGGGHIGGLLHVRDTLVPAYTARLDGLAHSMATDVNALATGGFDLNGTAGVNFFAAPTGVTGAARTLAVNPAVMANRDLVVTSSTTSAGNNDVALAIGRLQDAPMTGGTARPVDAWGELVYAVASDSSSAQQARDAHDEVAHQLENLWNQMSGVSIDEEAAMLMRFQTAYQANAKFFQVVEDTLDVLIQLAR